MINLPSGSRHGPAMMELFRFDAAQSTSNEMNRTSVDAEIQFMPQLRFNQ